MMVIRFMRAGTLLVVILFYGCSSGGRPESKPEEADAGPIFARGDCSEEGWCWVYPYPTRATLTGVWGTSPSDLYVAARKSILRFDGNTWTTVAGTSRVVLDLWGWSSNSIYATSEYQLTRFDGSSWSDVQSGQGSYPFRAVWGVSPTDVLAVGYRGTVVHFHGDSVDVVKPGVKADYNDVWGAAGTGYILVAGRGACCRCAGHLARNVCASFCAKLITRPREDWQKSANGDLNRIALSSGDFSALGRVHPFWERGFGAGARCPGWWPRCVPGRWAVQGVRHDGALHTGARAPADD